MLPKVFIASGFILLLLSASYVNMETQAMYIDSRIEKYHASHPNQN